MALCDVMRHDGTVPCNETWHCVMWRDVMALWRIVKHMMALCRAIKQHCIVSWWNVVALCRAMNGLMTLCRVVKHMMTLCHVVKHLLWLSNNKMAMVDVDDSSYRWTHSPSRLTWSEGWRPPGAQSAFIIWTGWTLAMVLRYDDSSINIVVVIVIIIIWQHCAECVVWWDVTALCHLMKHMIALCWVCRVMRCDGNVPFNETYDSTVLSVSCDEMWWHCAVLWCRSSQTTMRQA